MASDPSPGVSGMHPDMTDSHSSAESDAPTVAPIPTLSTRAFESEVLDGGHPVVVDFFATWCGPCAWILPTLEEIREEHGDRVRVVKVDVDASPELAERFGIASVPTVILFVGGAEVERSIGVEPKRVRAMPTRALASESS